MADLTPMMQQYFEIKEQNRDCILFFRLGDFYEMFDEDARLASRELDLTLTSRDRGKGKAPDEERIPMCGVPYHSSEGYIARLVGKGYKVAICEQTEDPALAKGLVKREIIRIVTPGALTESSMLDEGRNNYFACLYPAVTQCGLCLCDLSTGAFLATSVRLDTEAIISELGCFGPSEVLLCGVLARNAELRAALTDRLHCCVDDQVPPGCDMEFCKDKLLTQFGRTPTSLGLIDLPETVAAAGILLHTLEVVQRVDLRHIQSFEFYRAGRYLELDLTARRNLELTQTLRTQEKRGSLLWVLDRTKTAMGSRTLRAWLERPLLRPGLINERLDGVQELVDSLILREELSQRLAAVNDLERTMARISTGTANCRDFAALAAGCAILPELRGQLKEVHSPILCELRLRLDPLEDLHELIRTAIVDEPPFTVREGGMFREGYCPELDELRSVMHGGRGLLSGIEAAEKERTGIRSLKVGYNRVFGYYIEVSKTQSALVPESYIRKQTLVNCERYITPELKELENTILTASDRATAMEYELFCALREKLAAQTNRVLATAQAVACLDTLVSLAAVAAANGYCRPTLDNHCAIEIEDGRHPVVERMLRDSLFVPNSTRIGAPNAQVAIITGPNMAGKSTYMRQVALITIMAQMGSFVPARSAHIGIADRIFTRIGASDDLASGQSTFMVEMAEVAEILRHATSRSLLILDEIGRGTSTFDGMAIARAVLEHVADPGRIGARTLFATHYHELADIERQLYNVKNFNIAVKKRGDEMIFLRKIVPGATDDSYGIEVAQLAGLPKRVIARSREILRELESGRAASAPRRILADEPQLMMGDEKADAVRQRLEALSIDTLTPLEALNILYELKKQL